MNSIIEILNLWGERFLSLAWPLLWQSSLLIVVLLGLDLALRRRVRAAVRYALWLVVLVKLVLPPSLALPTGLAWWLQPRHAPPAKPQPTFVVTYGDATATELPPVIETAYTPPPPRLSRDGWVFAAWAAVSVVLLAWMGVRWRQIARDIRRAKPAPPWLDELLTAAREQAGLRRRVELRLTARPMSPAVCGLIRPVILLPRSLVEQLPPAQLRSVLLHELIHLRRGDVWVNCAQALLQVVYWWHPLLWLANARIRRAREEAVDDAVMLALRDDAESYAPTLLEVAKLAFHRPLASLGLVGILESRNALRQRIERLVSFRPPRRAGLSVVATLGIVAFAALAVPMGERPINSVALNAVDEPATRTNNLPTLTSPSNLVGEPSSAGNASQRGAPAETIEKFFVEKRPIWESTPGPRYSYSGKIGLLLNVEVRADGSCWSGSNRLDLSQLSAVLPQVEGTNSLLGVHVKADVKAPLQSIVTLFYRLQHLGIASISLAATGEGTTLVQTRTFKLDVKTFLPNLTQKAGWADPIGTEDVPVALRKVLSDVGVSLQTLEFCFYDDRKDLLFVRATQTEMERIQTLLEELNSAPPQITVDAKFNQPTASTNNLKTEAAKLVQNGRLLQEAGNFDDAEADLRKAITLDPQNRAAAYYLDLIKEIRQRQAGAQARSARYYQWSATNGNHAGSNATAATDSGTGLLLVSNTLVTRMFKVDPNTFNAAVFKRAGLGDTNDMAQFSAALRKLIEDIGVDLQPPKSLFYNDRQGTLLVRAAQSDLDCIQKLIGELNYTPPQITLASKFIEMPERDYVDLWAKWTPVSRSASGGWAVVLTSAQARELVNGLQAKPNVDIVTGPSVTTLSGRAQVAMADIHTILTGINPKARSAPGVASADGTNGLFQTEAIHFGPVLDLAPTVSADGYTLQMTVVPTVTEFIGYDKPGESVPVYVKGEKQAAALPLPRFRVRQTTASTAVWDGQTVVIGNALPVEVFTKPDGTSAVTPSTDNNLKRLIVLVTPTITDPAGNRVHSEEDMPFAKDGVPAQTTSELKPAVMPQLGHQRFQGEQSPLPNEEDYSAKGLQLECRPAKAKFVVGEPVVLLCTLTNTTDRTKRVPSYLGLGLHFRCVKDEASWFTGILEGFTGIIPVPVVTRKMHPSIKEEQFVLLLPPHTSLQLSLTMTPKAREGFRGILVYDPSIHGGRLFDADGLEKAKNACVFSRPFEYEVSAGKGK